MTARIPLLLFTGLGFLFMFTAHLVDSGCTQRENTALSFRDNEVLVKFGPEISHEHGMKIIEDLGCRVIRKKGRLYLLGIPEDETVLDMVERFSSLPEVEYAEPNYEYSIHE